MSRLRLVLERWAVPVLLRIACLLTIVALGITCFGILVPQPLPVMLGTSVGQGLIFLSLGFYVLAVTADSTRARSHRRSSAPPAQGEDAP